MVDLSTLAGSELYQRLLEPRGSRYQAALVLERGPESMLLLSLWRSERDFTDAEVRHLEAFRAVIAAALAFESAVDATCRMPRHRRTATEPTTRRRSRRRRRVRG